MNLSDINTVKSLIAKTGFEFKKSLGQNFLINPDVCPAMAKAACDKETGVIEIGPGIGVLTKELSRNSAKVVAIELDERLKRILPETLGDCENTEVIYGNAMKIDLKSLIKEKFGNCKRVAVCANLPYYITSPVIMHLLESRLPIDAVTVMVQKEAAERLCRGRHKRSRRCKRCCKLLRRTRNTLRSRQKKLYAAPECRLRRNTVKNTQRAARSLKKRKRVFQAC